MAHYSVSALLVSLRISDTPLSYTPPKGPPVRVMFTYNAYDVTQPANFTYGNVGPQWTTNWTSYIEDNIEDPDGNVFRVFPGGGGENETETVAYGPNDVTYAPESLTGAQLFKIGAETYKRVLPNGTVQLYSTWNHAAAYPSRIFLTSITGPHGNTVTLHYDSQMRLTLITDALGQVTTFHYDNPRYPLEITGVTDPFGRTATLTYDSEGQLTSTTDPLGITSRYMYRGTSSKIIALTTPYGTTHFQSAIVGNNRILTITDPLGHTEQIQYIQMGTMPYVDASPPACMALYNAELNLGDTYIWDPTVYAQYPDDFTKAKIYHWMHAQQTDSATREVEAVKYPLQHWRWYSYPGQTSPVRAGTLDKPSAIGVQLGNGKTSLTTLDRNAIGKVTERVSPDGYMTGYTYAANNVDLVKVQQLLVRPQTTPAPTPTCPLNLVCSTLTPPDLQESALDNFSPHPHLQAAVLDNFTPQPHLQAAVLDNFTPQPHLQPVLQMVPLPPTGSGAGQTCPSNSQYEPIPQGAPVPPGGGLVTLATYTYNNQHEPLIATNASGEATTYTYNVAGQLTSHIDPLGNTTRYVYNSAGYLTSIVNPNGQTEASFTYDADGRVASYTNAAGTTVQYTYDALNRLTGITYPDGTSRTYTYQNLNVVAVKNRLNQITHYGYDADGHLVTITSPLGQVTTLTRNADEKVIGITDPNGHITTWTRDIEERITSRTGPLGHTTIWAYGDGAGRLKSVTDPLGQTTQYSHTLAGRVRGIQFLSVSNPAFPNPPKTIVLGGLAPCLPFPSCFDSDNDSVTFTYGADFPHLVTMTDETGTTHYAYGIIGQPGALRLTNVLAPLPVATVQYQYDADNRVISRSINGIPETYSYDALNRIVSNTNSLGRFSYSYLGPTDLVTRQSLASSPVTIDYHYLPPNQNDRLAAIINRIGRGSVASFFYQTNALNEVMGIATRPIMVGNGRGLFGGFGGHQGPSVSFGQTFGPFVGRNFGAADLSYDADQRLIGTTGNLFGLTRYTYDDANNLLSVRNRQRSFAGRYNSANEIASANGQSLTYNADGELTSDGAQAFTWNAAHKLVSVTNARTGTTTVYMYNGLGERVGTAVWARGASSPVITETLWCGTTVCAAFSPNTTYTAASSPYSHWTAQYFPQGEVDGSQSYLYTRNNIGSVTALVTPQGTVAGQYSYSPYGQMSTTGTTTTPPPTPAFGYAGMVTDQSTGLNLTLYRAYDPQLRRWVSRDPMGFAAGINVYAYVLDNPMNAADPFGLWSLSFAGYAGPGGAILIGQDPKTGHWFYGGRIGFGLGGGVSFDYKGKRPGGSEGSNCGHGTTYGDFVNLGGDIGPYEWDPIDAHGGYDTVTGRGYHEGPLNENMTFGNGGGFDIGGSFGAEVIGH
ncbi:MAG TPA: RHS repeat-associated core domain-containing protein [Acidiferrobacter sp.]|nr:RHS repeat-associated core domain-containing protein [Acidiferrobacter sp.]